MDFESELAAVLPPDLPEREALIIKTAKHLALIVAANEYMNLTRITSPREAAIKHVLDSVLPWRLFADAKNVLDVGSGAGFPGIPLSIVLPETRFVLAESVGKKARFVEAAVAELALGNVEVRAERAEQILEKKRFHIVTARAVAPVSKTLKLFGAAVRKGDALILYKGPDVEEELMAARPEIQHLRARAKVILRYELPDDAGTRTIVKVEKI